MDPGETNPDIVFEALSNIFGFIHYDSGVRCDPKPIMKMSFLTSALNIIALL